MVKNKLSILLLLFFCLFLSSVHCRPRNQIDALNDLFKAKLKNRKSFTTYSNQFEPNLHLEDVNIFSDDGSKEKDKIEKLPGQPPVDFDQYGGYITVNQSAGRAFFYYFVEAPQNKESLPLLLWLNGGPGCSSLGYGAMEELGPFRVLSDGKTLYRNLFAWNNAANVLFVESPARVGFSYSNTTSDNFKSGDEITASDNYAFLLNWLARFPEYKDRDFYISGESYAGRYVPQLAATILYHNKKANKTLINLKGIIIGNAVINDDTDTLGMYDYFASHALISDQSLNEIHEYCFSPNATDIKCDIATSKATSTLYQNIDIYNIYSPVCTNGNLTSRPKKVSYEVDPCIDFYTDAYLNRPDVQKALHANVTKLDYRWESCSDSLDWLYSSSTSIPLLQEFMVSGLRVWIFSGDIDGRVPVTSTLYSLNTMNLKVKTPWHPWLINQQVGGYTEVYQGNLTFATVRGAGHQVPSYEPRRALALISHFLNGTPLPFSSKD
ncbi:Carboxypeptidase [Heracleum sosnowskyi]|uniref:Carboxypeptidase n=1 Tax=Heracleum sosnowskyi TaxID=360622 RepID=A0AAD8M5N7_9APIA|nr:Carboxypeptidase [Heracleum sosnowskyi]